MTLYQPVHVDITKGAAERLRAIIEWSGPRFRSNNGLPTFQSGRSGPDRRGTSNAGTHDGTPSAQGPGAAAHGDASFAAGDESAPSPDPDSRHARSSLPMDGGDDGDDSDGGEAPDV